MEIRKRQAEHVADSIKYLAVNKFVCGEKNHPVGAKRSALDFVLLLRSINYYTKYSSVLYINLGDS